MARVWWSLAGERDLRVRQFCEWKKRLCESEAAQFVEVEVMLIAKTMLQGRIGGTTGELSRMTVASA